MALINQLKTVSRDIEKFISQLKTKTFPKNTIANITIILDDHIGSLIDTYSALTPEERPIVRFFATMTHLTLKALEALSEFSTSSYAPQD